MGTCVSRLSTILIGFVGFAAMTLFAETARGMWHLAEQHMAAFYFS